MSDNKTGEVPVLRVKAEMPLTLADLEQVVRQARALGFGDVAPVVLSYTGGGHIEVAAWLRQTRVPDAPEASHVLADVVERA